MILCMYKIGEYISINCFSSAFRIIFLHALIIYWHNSYFQLECKKLFVLYISKKNGEYFRFLAT